jgi:prevent-host-death family protein
MTRIGGVPVASRRATSIVVDAADAKARLPELIERAAGGEEIILARAGKPRARLVPLADPATALRVPGKGKGRFRLKRGFDTPLDDDALALFDGGGRPAGRRRADE